tara:strand:+ start:264 stop:1223 length:960 start_codon:yes stop_codon:yes gene_type:complete
MTFEPVFPIQDRFKISDIDLLNRFCVAKKWKKDTVHELVPRYSRWRKEEQIDKIGQDVWPPIITDLLVGFCGKDFKGQPIYYDRPDPEELAALLRVCPPQQCLRWHVATCECLKALQFEAGTERFTGVVDLSKIGLMSLRHASVLTTFAENSLIDQRFYPENLDRMFLVNPPRSLQILWAAVSHFMDENTKKKLHFVDREEANRQLGVTWDEVPVEFGGTLETGLRRVPEVLQAFEHRPPDLPFGYGKHKTLLPNDADDQQSYGTGKLESEAKERCITTAASLTAPAMLQDCYTNATSTMSAYIGTPSSLPLIGAYFAR